MVSSLSWDNSSAVNAGAVTWGNGTTGIVGEISSSNSLIGSRASDQIGSGTITILPNNNYVILSPLFDAPAAANIGAATLGNGAGGTVGEITSGNSLIGAHKGFRGGRNDSRGMS
ncbi:MAG: hypothetical protein IPK98_16355 [Chloracidobacterium sp.]|nr:hypothetical protein [Chloracidobacterium sp.]